MNTSVTSPARASAWEALLPARWGRLVAGIARTHHLTRQLDGGRHARCPLRQCLKTLTSPGSVLVLVGSDGDEHPVSTAMAKMAANQKTLFTCAASWCSLGGKRIPKSCVLPAKLPPTSLQPVQAAHAESPAAGCRNESRIYLSTPERRNRNGRTGIGTLPSGRSELCESPVRSRCQAVVARAHARGGWGQRRSETAWVSVAANSDRSLQTSGFLLHPAAVHVASRS